MDEITKSIKFAAVYKLPVPQQLKYFAARAIYAKRDELLPKDEKNADGVPEPMTWAQWFEKRYNQSLDEYVGEAQRLTNGLD